MKRSNIIAFAVTMLFMCFVCSCENNDKLGAYVEQAAATLPKNLDEDGVTKWNSVSYDKESNIVTFEYIYNSEYVTEEAFAASDADMKSALVNFLHQDVAFMKAASEAKPKIKFVLSLSGSQNKKEILIEELDK